MTSSPEIALRVENLEVIFNDASGVVHALRDLTFSLACQIFCDSDRSFRQW